MSGEIKENITLKNKVTGKLLTISKKTPVIVSASRSTDIPAFFSDWFIERIKAGFSIWHNPFNRSDSGKQFISYEKTRAIVFWTKNPKPFLTIREDKDNPGQKYSYIDFLEKNNIEYYFQFTLNDYEKEHLEPHLPSIEDRIEIFKQLSNRVSAKRIIWRFDPLIKIPGQSIEDLIKRIFKISEQIKGYTNKLVFSFADIQNYRGVMRNLVKECDLFSEDNISSAEFTLSEMEIIAKRLSDMRNYWISQGWNIELASCAEQVDLDKFGISHNRCIDALLLYDLANDSQNKELLSHIEDFLTSRKKRIKNHSTNENLDLFSQFGPSKETLRLNKFKLKFQSELEGKFKDKGQRKECKCMVSKDIGEYHTCMHGCAYCYATVNHDLKETARKGKEFKEESSLYELVDNIQL